MTAVAVVGAGGQVGRAVVDALVDRDVEVVQVGRNGSGPGVISRYDATELGRALQGCDAAVATLGLPYRAAVWRAEWPPLVAAVGQACAQVGVPLTFLDNLYAVGAPSGPITESSPPRPCSEKGRARLAGLHELDQARAAGLDAVVCRASDFVGPGVDVTVLPWRALDGALRNGSLTWYGRRDVQHSYAWVPEIARCLVEVALRPEMRDGEVVNLPVLAPVTGDQVAAAVSDLRGATVRLRVMGDKTIRAASLVSSAAREQREMMYEFCQDFVVDDHRIRALGWTPQKLSLADCLEGALGQR